jgi:hypothetical protein
MVTLPAIALAFCNEMTRRQYVRAGAFGTRSRTQLIGLLLCLPTATVLYEGTGDFGTSPIFVQLPGKPLLAVS